MRFSLFFILFSFVISGFAQNANRSDIPFEKYTLNNGLTVILHPDMSSPIVAAEVWYKVGSKDEIKGQYGISKVIEKLMFMGSEHVSDGEFKRTIQDGAGRVGSRVSADKSEYFEVIPHNLLQTVLWMEADRMRSSSSVLTEDKIAKSKKTALDELESEKKMPGDYSWYTDLFALSYKENYPYHHPLNGNPQDIEALELNEIKSFIEKYYTPNNAILTVSGDMDTSLVKYLINGYFSGIARGPEINTVSWPLPVFQGPREKTKYVNIQTPEVFINYPFPAMGNRETYALDIAAQIIGNGASSRLYHKLVDEKKIASDVEITPWSMELNSHFIIVVKGFGNISGKELAREIEAIIYSCGERPFTPEEMMKGKNQLKLYLTRFLDTNLGKDFLFDAFESIFGKPDLITKEVFKYDDITSTEVDNAVHKYLTSKNSNTLIYEPKK